MPEIIDVSHGCGNAAGYLAGTGVKTVIRYYSRDTGIPEKRLTLKEARQFATAGLRIGIVHEARHGNKPDSFTRELGVQDGSYAREFGGKVIGQPAGSSIFFGVDFDASDAQVKNLILPFFEGVREAFSAANDLPTYRIGVYGSGRTCRAAKDAGVAELTWLAQSRGWAGYKTYLDSGDWTLKQLMPTSVGEVDCDPNVANPKNPDIGDFLPAIQAVGLASSAVEHATVIARTGLRLRAGPSTQFDVLKMLPFGQVVQTIKSDGDWALVDLEGDGKADGFVSAHFLQSA